MQILSGVTKLYKKTNNNIEVNRNMFYATAI